MTTPRVFLARHGETEWTLNGRHTGISEIPLTARGEAQVLASSRSLVGPGRLIDPARVSHIFVSPRVRAQRTYSLLFPGGLEEEGGVQVVTEMRLAEWGYGLYEGWYPAQIREDRRKRGLDRERGWDIWRDGCESGGAGGVGESPQEVKGRLDSLIAQIREIQAPYMNGGKPVDVVLVSHGHLLRAFTKRWLGMELGFNVQLILEPGGIGTLTYNHHNVEEPAFLLGGVFKDPEAEAELVKALM